MKDPKFTIHNSCNSCNNCNTLQYIEIEDKDEIYIKKAPGTQFIIRNKNKIQTVRLIINNNIRKQEVDIFPLELNKVLVLNDTIIKEKLN